jgi:hypothetical protein
MLPLLVVIVHKDNDSLMVRNSDIKGEGMKQSRKGV